MNRVKRLPKLSINIIFQLLVVFTVSFSVIGKARLMIPKQTQLSERLEKTKSFVLLWGIIEIMELRCFLKELLCNFLIFMAKPTFFYSHRAHQDKPLKLLRIRL